MIAAARRGKASDVLATALAVVGLCVPTFWLGLLLILVFAVDLHWLPATGYVTVRHPIANLRHLVLPCLALGTGSPQCSCGTRAPRCSRRSTPTTSARLGRRE